MSRVMQVTKDGKVYQIPEIWVAGFCTVNPGGVQAAVEHWIQQAEWAALDEQD